MVVVHRAHGFRFVIYTQDHEPEGASPIGGLTAPNDTFTIERHLWRLRKHKAP